MAITKETALEELRRYRREYPRTVPDVTAFSLVRRAESLDEVQAIAAALDAILLEEAGH